MTPRRNQRMRAAARARRRRGALTLGALSLAASLGAVVALTGTGSHRTSGTASAGTGKARASTARASSTPRTRLSPAGFALSGPAFHLEGIARPGDDAVAPGFHTPPGAGLLFDLDTGRVLWQRHALARLRIASLTKMMTALLAVESSPPDARVLVSRQAVLAAGSKVGVLPRGRHVPFESMLYGLLLPSGNDAAVAIAEHVAGGVGPFVRQMNLQAAKLGLGCTRFSSPSGYIDEHNFSCAADLAVLAHEDLRRPRVARIVRSRSAVLPFPIKGGKLYLYNNNPLLIYRYPGLTGLKTGYTVASGRCLVATAERRGVRLGVVLLHSPDPATQARDLLDRGFEEVYDQAPPKETPLPPQA